MARSSRKDFEFITSGYHLQNYQMCHVKPSPNEGQGAGGGREKEWDRWEKCPNPWTWFKWGKNLPTQSQLTHSRLNELPHTIYWKILISILGIQVQGSGNFEIWIGPADDDDVINEPISK